MTIEYLIGTETHVAHIDARELGRWTAEHPQAIVLHATPDPAAARGEAEGG